MKKKATTEKVRDVMTPNPATLEIGAPTMDAARIMRDQNVGAVVVVENGKFSGILTDRDIVVRAIATGRDPAGTPVREICSREVATVSPEDSIDRVLEQMRTKAIRRLPVVQDGRAVGILSLGDLALERDPGSVLGEISAAPPNV
jgi:CBS domain-containing protein